MRKIISIIFVLSIANISIAQVTTKFSKSKKDFQLKHKIIPSLDEIPIKEMVYFNSNKLLNETKFINEEISPFKFGQGFQVDIDLKDGKWYDLDTARLWSMKIMSKDAYSLNFIFQNFYLPEDAELYIFNEDETMIYGPVTNKNIPTNGFFLTDLVSGEKVTIQIFEPKHVKNKSTLKIIKVVHAYVNLFTNLTGVGYSDSCNIDVNCFPNWENESDAVALVLLANGNELCSGSLLNNTAQDFRAYFLSAFHCIDIGDPDVSGDPDENNRILEDYEISEAENWAFRFQFKKTTCDGSVISSTITYNRADFRAAWNETDFALMELINSPLGDETFTWLGWDKTGNIPNSGTGIHHLSGDVMKISFDNDQLSETSNAGITGQNYWRTQMDNGTLERGSSGSPLFCSYEQNN